MEGHVDLAIFEEAAFVFRVCSLSHDIVADIKGATQEDSWVSILFVDMAYVGLDFQRLMSIVVVLQFQDIILAIEFPYASSFALGILATFYREIFEDQFVFTVADISIISQDAIVLPVADSIHDAVEHPRRFGLLGRSAISP